MTEVGTLTVRDLAAALAGGGFPLDLVPPAEISGAVIDSRLATPGCLFIALRGEREDGHDYIVDALSKGAAAVIAERVPPEALCQSLPAGVGAEYEGAEMLRLPLCFIAENSLQALQKAAAYWRRQREVRVIGITGSVGKTTSKESIAAVVKQRFCTLKSEGNYNNEIGLPLTLLHLTAEHERSVLEMGMYALGEIAQLAAIALPQVGVVTNVGPIHLERLGSMERIAQAKAELPRALPPADEGGVAVLNFDDERVRAMAAQTEARVFTYGLTPEADLWADGIQSEGLRGIHFRFHYGPETIHARLPLLGRHSVHSALVATAVGLVEGLSWEEILTGLRDQSVQLRLVAVPGPDDSTLLDDTYNSSPVSCIAALNLLSEIQGRKIAVLGDMYELGQYAEEGHKLVGRRARDVVDLLITVGSLGRLIGEEALKAGMEPDKVYMVDSNSQAIELLRQLVQPGPPGDRILVKGSRGMAMEEIVAALQEETSP